MNSHNLTEHQEDENPHTVWLPGGPVDRKPQFPTPSRNWRFLQKSIAFPKMLVDTDAQKWLSHTNVWGPNTAHFLQQFGALRFVWSLRLDEYAYGNGHSTIDARQNVSKYNAPSQPSPDWQWGQGVWKWKPDSLSWWFSNFCRNLPSPSQSTL